jgi:hypothetical protein
MADETNYLSKNFNQDVDALAIGFKTMLARYLAENGFPAETLSNDYGWKDYNMEKHFNPRDGSEACKIVSVTSVKEDEWIEFVDTYYEGDTTHYGLQGEAECACGKFSGFLRAEGNITEIIPAMLKMLAQI